MPHPHAGETREKFISRCMSYGDLQSKPSKQRLGECFGLWRGKHPSDTQKAFHGSCPVTCACDDCRNSVKAYTYKLAPSPLTTGDGETPDPSLTYLLALDPTVPEPVTDDNEMSAIGVLASSNRDWQGDVIEVEGVNTEQHRRNPIVFWNHGRQYDQPIGKAEDSAGNYTVLTLPEYGVMTQKTFFNQRSALAVQIYHAIQDRFIRANSIGLKDIEVDPLPPDPENGHMPRRDEAGRPRPYKHIVKSLLAEVTWTALPANPDAVRSLLGHSRYHGDPLHPVILKSFLPYLPTKKPPTVRGGYVPQAGLTLKSLTLKTDHDPANGQFTGPGGSSTSPTGSHEGIGKIKALKEAARPGNKERPSSEHVAKVVEEATAGLKSTKEAKEFWKGLGYARPVSSVPDLKKKLVNLFAEMNETHARSEQITNRSALIYQLTTKILQEVLPMTAPAAATAAQTAPVNGTGDTQKTLKPAPGDVSNVSVANGTQTAQVTNTRKDDMPGPTEGEAQMGSDLPPQGSEEAKTLHQVLSYGMDHIANARNENPAICDHFAEAHKSLNEMCKSLADVHNKEYPEEEPIEHKSLEDGRGDEKEPAGEGEDDARNRAVDREAQETEKAFIERASAAVIANVQKAFPTLGQPAPVAAQTAATVQAQSFTAPLRRSEPRRRAGGLTQKSFAGNPNDELDPNDPLMQTLERELADLTK